MKYIYDDGCGFDHRPYWNYLESIRNAMPEPIYRFSANTEHHDLTHPNSLHDSWLMSWSVNESLIDGKVKSRHVSIECCLLGSRHDRIIRLSYGGVVSHHVREPSDAALLTLRGHGDLLVHEIQLVQEGIFSHELVFSTGFVFLCHFSKFAHRVEMIER